MSSSTTVFLEEKNFRIEFLFRFQVLKNISKTIIIDSQVIPPSDLRTEELFSRYFPTCFVPCFPYTSGWVVDSLVLS